MLPHTVDLLIEFRTQNEEVKNTIAELIKQNKIFRENSQRIIEENEALKAENQTLKTIIDDFKNQTSILLNQIQTQNDQSLKTMQNEIQLIQKQIEPISKFEEIQRNQSAILTTLNKMSSQPRSFPFISISSFNGILNYLRSKGRIQLISGGTEMSRYSILNLIDFSVLNESSYGAYGTLETNWIEFSFPNSKIDLISYQIKSYNAPQNNCHPKTWIIKGSNDHDSWEPLDSRTNNSDLNAKSITKHFECQTRTYLSYKYIRFYQVENWSQTDKLSIRLSRFELYGDIYKCV